MKFILQILPNNPAARRTFVASGGLRKVQELIANEATSDDAILREHVTLYVKDNTCSTRAAL